MLANDAIECRCSYEQRAERISGDMPLSTDEIRQDLSVRTFNVDGRTATNALS